MNSGVRAARVAVVVAVLGLVAAAVCMASCLTPRFEIRSENVRELAELVCGRVERYAAADGALEPQDRASLAGNVSAVRGQLAQPTADQRLLAPPLTHLCDRHDGWVIADSALNPVERSVFLETTTRLRSLIDLRAH